jgi:hypothetical protein
MRLVERKQAPILTFSMLAIFNDRSLKWQSSAGAKAAHHKDRHLAEVLVIKSICCSREQTMPSL